MLCLDKDNLFENSGVSLSNITELSLSQSVLDERRICEIHNVALSAFDFFVNMRGEGMELYEILSLISEDFPELSQAHHAEALKENSARLEKMRMSRVLFDKMSFAELFVELSGERGYALSEKDFLPEDFEGARFVYVKNIYSDEAYDVFSQSFADPRVKYSATFKEALLAVCEGEADFAVLPLEERGARIASISEMLFKHDLKINSVIPVFGIDGQADIKYAMVSKNYTVPEIDSEDDRYLEIRLAQNSDFSLSDLLSAAFGLGASVYRVNTQSFSTEEGVLPYYSVVFCGEGVDFTALLVFLTLFVKDYRAVGIYKNLEE